MSTRHPTADILLQISYCRHPTADILFANGQLLVANFGGFA